VRSGPWLGRVSFDVRFPTPSQQVIADSGSIALIGVLNDERDRGDPLELSKNQAVVHHPSACGGVTRLNDIFGLRSNDPRPEQVDRLAEDLFLALDGARSKQVRGVEDDADWCPLSQLLQQARCSRRVLNNVARLGFDAEFDAGPSRRFQQYIKRSPQIRPGVRCHVVGMSSPHAFGVARSRTQGHDVCPEFGDTSNEPNRVGSLLVSILG
jgi:hypothetical protein